MAQTETGGTFASPLDAALRYAERGWPVFPCRPDKKPYTDHGFNDASTERDAVIEWWRKWPKAHVGISTGPAGLCVVDLDYSPSKGKDGIAVFDRLRDENGPHGCGLVASTPRGGRHYVYLMPDPPVGCATDVIPGSGIDVRAEGGYVVAPCGIDGREWVEGDPFDVGMDGSTNLCPMPEWVLRLVGHRADKRKCGDSAGGNSVDPIPLGSAQVGAIRRALAYIDNSKRQVWIRVGMALKSTGAQQQAYDLWVEWSATSPKYDAEDQAYQWRNIREYRIDGTEVAIGTLFFMAREGGYVPETSDELAAEAIPVPDPAPPPKTKRPFPVELMNCPGLVGSIAEWIVNSSRRQQKAMCLASAIVTVGAILGRRVATPSDLRTNVYALGIGETACGKDPSVTLPNLLLTRAGLGWAVGPGEWKSDSGLRAALIAAPSHAAYVDELTKLLDMMSGRQVPGHVKGIKKYLLSMWAASNSVHLSPAYANRELNQPVVIQQPNLCVYGTGVPSELFSSLDRGALRDGFLNRMLIFFADEQQPPIQKIGRAEPPAALVQQMVDIDEATKVPSSHIHDLVPGTYVVPMTPEAQAKLDQLEIDNDKRIAEMRAKGEVLSDLWVRFGAHVAKLALVRTAGDDPRRAIDVPDVDWAVALVVWCLERTMAESEERVADNEHEALGLRVRRVIAAAGPEGILASELARKTQWLQRNQRKDYLATFIEGGLVVSLEVKAEGSRKASTRYVAAEFAAPAAEPAPANTSTEVFAAT